MTANRTPAQPTDLVDEATRLAVLRSTNLMDSDSEAVFDTIVEIARRAVGCSTALISLVDADRQWFKAKCGLATEETPREHAFCAHTITSPDALVVSDATRDPRFRDNPLVIGDPHIRMYAGFPLRIRSEVGGYRVTASVGTLCVIDGEPRDISEAERTQLRALADIVQALFEARASATAAVDFADELSRRRQESERNNRQFRQAERMANIGSWRLMLEDNSIHWSDQVFEIHGLPAGGDPNLIDALQFYPPESREIVSQALAKTIETGESFSIETDLIAANGNRRRVRSKGELELQNGRPVAVMGVFQDITSRHQLDQKLRQLAHHDGLTGLPNRASFDDYLDTRLAAFAETGEPLTLLLIDLDGFKLVNDKRGHHRGDELLQMIAGSLRAPYLDGCFAARLGGDEFVLIVEGNERCEAIDPLIDRVLEGMRHTIETSDGPIEVSGSIGISRWLGPVQDRRALLRSADVALYAAKHAGRNCARESNVTAVNSKAKRKAA